MTFEATLEACGLLIERRLGEWLSADRQPNAPAHLLDAIRYAALGGGKRFRPFLVIETARMLGLPADAALDAGAALECVHCYSLVHDDLPAMDDDDIRRGRPTVHRRFGEATAILVGDALLTLAFEIAASPSAHSDPAVRNELLSRLAQAAGSAGMVGGQMLDLAAEGRFASDGGEIAVGQRLPLTLSRQAVERLQSLKTGALISFGVEAGAILGRAGPGERQTLGQYASALGRAFQLSDDLLDAEGDASVIGKATAKDGNRGKATLVGLLDIAGARQELARLEAEATSALACFGDRARTLVAAAHFMAKRRS